MTFPLVFLALLTAVFVFRAFLRSGSRRMRPIFEQNGIFAGRRTEGLVHALISDRGFMRPDTRVAGIWGSAVVIDRDGACGRLVLYPALGFGRESDLPGLRTIASQNSEGRSPTLVVVGGSEEFGRSAFAATAPLRTLHIDDAGQVHEARRGFRSAAPRLVIESALDRMEADLKDGAFPSLDFETSRSLVSSDLETDLGPVPPFRGVVTVALSLAIVLCFAVEVAIGRDAFWGEGAALSIVYRMGGIHQPAILAGEWQRVIAAPFLHFGLLHLAMNGWAQWSLGAPLEFLIGPWRFLALWVGSAIGASITSLVFNDSSVSAGASGAIFGLLGAFTTFVFFRKDILPQPVPRSLRNGVLATLLLNLMISFIPSIDMAAHAGGFVAGAVLAFGLVRRHRGAGLVGANPSSLRLVVAALVLLGVGVTSAQERADLSTTAPEIEGEHRIGELVLPVPRSFMISETRERGLTVVDAQGGPASPFDITFKVSEPHADRASALRNLRRRVHPDSKPTKDSGWIAISQTGVRNLRVVEIIVVTPSSCQAEAEKLSTTLAALVR